MTSVASSLGPVWPTSSPTGAWSTETASWPSSRASTSCRFRQLTTSRKECSCSRPWPNGVPVVQPRRGAFVEIIEKTGGGLLVDPDDTDSLARGLYTLWQDRGRTADLGQRAFSQVREHYTIAHSASRLLDVYDDVLASGSESSNADAMTGADRIPAHRAGR